MDFPFNKDITYFAKTNFRGTDQIFGIKRKDRRQHMYLLGKSGTGKSVTLENMIIQNIHQGEGVCVVDPHGELVEKILETIPPERAKDVIYFNPADTDHNIGFNVLQLDDPRYKHLVASGLMGIFTKIWANAWSSRMEYILNNTILALLDTPDTTLLGIPRMLVDKDYRQYIINNLKDPVVKAFWVHEYEAWRDQFRNEAIAPIQNKVGQFLSSNIVRNVVGQTRSTINIFDIMNQKKIFLVNVSKGRIGEDNSALLGGMLITKLQLSAMERVRIPENQREDFYLYVDEFQNFVTDSFASILSEARKYRLCLTIAHQYIAQLESESGSAVKDAVFGNVGTMIIFRVGADDAESIEKEFDPEFTVEDFVNLPNYHIYTKLMVDGVTSRPFSAKTLPPVSVDSSEETKNLIIETSRKIYTRERAAVEAEIQKWSSTVPGQSRPDGEETEGKFKVDCSNCKKSIYVPFEPEEGRPVYCKECLFKIKNGELEPTSGFRAPREKRDTISYDALANLGIEFSVEARRPDRSFDRRDTRPAPTITRPPQSRPVVDKPVYQAPRPPSGMIKADTRDIPSTQNSNKIVVPDRDMAVPNPRAVKMPITKERKGPDVAGLQGLLKNALQGVVGTTTPKENTPTFSEVKKENVPSVSLNQLRQKSVPSNYVIPQKDASVEKQNLLKDAILKAVGDKKELDEEKSMGLEVDSSTKQSDEEIQKQKEIEKRLQEETEAKEKLARENERIIQEQERERIRIQTLEEEKKKLEQEKQKELELQKQRELERERAHLAELERIRKEQLEREREMELEKARLLQEKIIQEQQIKIKIDQEREDVEKKAKAETERLLVLEQEKAEERMRELAQKAYKEADTAQAQEKPMSPDTEELEKPTEKRSKKTKEIPEDLLRKILE